MTLKHYVLTPLPHMSCDSSVLETATVFLLDNEGEGVRCVKVGVHVGTCCVRACMCAGMGCS